GDLQRRRGLLALRAVPQQAGAADGLEHLALRQRAGRRARRAGAPQPEPDRAREALRRGAGHHRERDGVDPDLHDEGDHRHARDREGLPDPPRRVQPGALEDLARPLRWGAPTWPPIPPSVRSAPGNPWRSSLPPAFGAPRATRGAPLFRRMLTFVVRRLLLAVPVLLGVVFVVMLTIDLLPGDAVTLMLGEHATKDAVAALREHLGLDKPFAARYVDY